MCFDSSRAARDSAATRPKSRANRSAASHHSSPRPLRLAASYGGLDDRRRARADEATDDLAHIGFGPTDQFNSIMDLSPHVFVEQRQIEGLLLAGASRRRRISGSCAVPCHDGLRRMELGQLNSVQDTAQAGDDILNRHATPRGRPGPR
jgi:hypothetical protein